jgi:hypothetical protein
MLESCPIKRFFIESSLLVDLKVYSFGVELVVLNFFKVK